MQINDLFNQYNIAVNQGQSVQKQTGQGQQINNVLNSLSSGSIFEGSVNKVDNGQVIIGLSNGQTLSARLDSGVSISEGQSVFFQVKSNDGETLKIRPLQTDNFGNPTLLKALNAAGIEATAKTIDMVNTMMKEGMSIDSDSLLGMNRSLLGHPDASVNTLIEMTKAGIEISPANISMFEAYKANDAQISQAISDLSQNIGNLFSNNDISDEVLINTNKNIVDVVLGNSPLAEIVSENTKDISIASNDDGQQSPNEISQSKADGQFLLDNENTINSDKTTVNGLASDTPNISSDAEQVNINNDIIKDHITESIRDHITESINDHITESINDGINESFKAPTKDNQTVNTSLLEQSLSAKEISLLEDNLSKYPDFIKANSQLFDGEGKLSKDVSAQELLKALSDFTISDKAESVKNLSSLFRTNEYSKLLESALKDSWSIEPKDITKTDALKNLYDKILRQNEMLQKAVQDLPEKMTADIKSQSLEIRENVTFMNQVNDLYTFVQIPLKFSNQTSNGELYVYNNKNVSKTTSDELSAFLHFDLENLGSTDIAIKLKDKNVNCKWYLESESSLELIEKNIDKLDERLKAKGYNCSFSCEAEKKDVDFFNDFLRPAMDMNSSSTGRPVNGKVSRYSFDMRA